MSVPCPPHPPHHSAPQRRSLWLLVVGALALIIVLVAAVAVIAVRSGSPSATASCADVEFIGAAGSGQRDSDPSSGITEIADSGVGGIVEDTYQNLAVDLPEGTDINLRTVEYPATAVPVKPTVDNWTAFMDSVSTGASEAEQLIRTTTEECGDSKIVVAGFSQGAMAVHRALRAIGPDARITAVVLIGDGDKVPYDNVETIPEYGTDARQGIAQVALHHGIDSGAVDDALPMEWKSRIISPCMSGDVVCAPNSFELLRLTAHVSYDADDWRRQLLSKVAS